MADLEVKEWDNLKGPGLIPCERHCEIPEGVKLTAFPECRHAWDGIFNCPHNCGRSFEIAPLTNDVDAAVVVSAIAASI